MNVSKATAIPEGSVLAVHFGLIRHVGIVTGFDDHGQPRVTSNSARMNGVVEEPLAVFNQGRQTLVLNENSVLPSSEVVARARTLIGLRWDFWTFNCEHFVEWVQGRRPKSRQMHAWMLLIGLGLLAWITTKRLP